MAGRNRGPAAASCGQSSSSTLARRLIALINMGSRARKKLEEYCRRLKDRLANLTRTLRRLTREDRLVFKARIDALQQEFDEICQDGPTMKAPGATI